MFYGGTAYLMLLRPQAPVISPIVRELREIRQAWKMPIEQVAMQADIHPRCIGHWESGKYEPKLSTLEQVADVLGYELVLRPKK